MKQKKEEKKVAEKKKVKDEVSKMGYKEASLDDLDAVSGGLAAGCDPSDDASCHYSCVTCQDGKQNG